MDCKKCGIEMRLDSREVSGGLKQEFSCRNPQCEGYGTVQESRLLKEDDNAEE